MSVFLAVTAENKIISPRLGKVCPVGHHVPGQSPLLLCVDHGGMEPQRVPEDVGDLVPVHHPGPGRPGRVLGPVGEMVEEDPAGDRRLGKAGAGQAFLCMIRMPMCLNAHYRVKFIKICP